MPKASRVILTLILCSVLLLSFPHSLWSQPSAILEYDYRFDVNEDGFTHVQIDVLAEGDDGDSGWILVPKNQDTQIRGSKGRITDTFLGRAIAPGGSEFVFYDNLTFAYEPQGGVFRASLSYNFTHGAFVIEPDGFFYSPQIGFPSSSTARATVVLPGSFLVEEENVHLDGDFTGVERTGDHVMITADPASLDRVSVQFEVDGDPDLELLEEGVFNAEVVRRYTGIAQRFLDLYDQAYPFYVDVFNTTIDEIDVVLFVPSYSEFIRQLGGFVPIGGDEEVGSIHINIFYLRTLSGTLEIIALHELTHHFALKKGISTDRLWFHEGLAQFMGVQSAHRLGYQDAAEDATASYLAVDQSLNGQYGFLQDWRPEEDPTDVTAHYSAAFAIFAELNRSFGGLDFFREFLGELDTESSVDISDKEIVDRLGREADEDLRPLFSSWGFDILDAEYVRQKLDSVWERLSSPSLVISPFYWLAGLLALLAQRLLERGGVAVASSLAEYALDISRILVPLTVITYAGIALALVYLGYSRSSRDGSYVYESGYDDTQRQGVSDSTCGLSPGQGLDDKLKKV